MTSSDMFPIYDSEKFRRGIIPPLVNIRQQRNKSYKIIAEMRGYKTSRELFEALIKKHDGDRVLIGIDMGITGYGEVRRLANAIHSNPGLKLKKKRGKKTTCQKLPGAPVIRFYVQGGDHPCIGCENSVRGKFYGGTVECGKCHALELYNEDKSNEDPIGRGMPGCRGGSFEQTTSVIYDRCGFARAGG